MKIKRFEASNMSEALRMIKKEFGEDAVILSAKTMQKSRGVMGNKPPRKVVVTAAIDKTPAIEPMTGSRDLEEMEPQGHSSASESDDMTYHKFSFLKKYRPITRTGQNKVQPKIVQLMTETAEPSPARAIESRLSAQGVSPENSTELANQTVSLLVSDHAGASEKGKALSQALDAMQLVRPTCSMGGQKPRVVVMAGPSGVGKTSAAVKLAARHVIDCQETVAIISLDNQRMAGACELERYAAIMALPLKMAHNAQQAAQALKAFDTADLVVVDTPGLALDDHRHLQSLKTTLSAFGNFELHLLLSSTAQEKVMARTISFFKPLNIDRLLFTKLDWALDIGPMINQSMISKIPISYLCDSPKVPEGMHAANAAELSALLLPEKDSSEMTGEGYAHAAARRKITQMDGPCYVANRNSDIFHHSSCKSVKRIHTDNMKIFKNPAEAMGQDFKPCRMCCSQLIVTKPIERLARQYAGNRC